MDIESFITLKGLTLGVSIGFMFGWLLCWLNFRSSNSHSDQDSSDRHNKE